MTILTRRRFLEAVAGAGALTVVACLPTKAAALDLCPYCGMAPYGPLG
jgi:hypothetical protein